LNNTIYLVDAYAHIYRGYHAVRGLSTSGGKPSNAIYAMGRFLLTLEKEFSPDLGAFVFDLGAPVKRLEIAPDYKANRPSMPDDMRQQISVIREMIEAAGWILLEKEGNEADDILAALACRFNKNPVRIISNDKDIAQVIDERVQMLITVPRIKGFVVRDIKNVINKFEVKPEQVIDYLSLIGDSSDNIPGVQGVGPKTAVKLLEQFGSIDEIIRRVDEIKRVSLKEKIVGSTDILRKNRELITLDTSIELEKCSSPDHLNMRMTDIDKLLDIANEYELKSLASEFSKVYENRMNPSLFDF
jgi:DNA polymerase I